MTDVFFICNVGSSSVKFALYQAHEPLSRLLYGQVEDVIGAATLWVKDADDQAVLHQRLTHSGHKAAMASILDWLAEHNNTLHLVASGHRVVHGGQQFAEPVLVDDARMQALESFIPLAPLHQPYNLQGISAIRKRYPNIPHIACFDTAFHRTQSRLAELFALPRRYYDEGILRYGFHGLSYEHIANVLPQSIGAKADGRVIVAHLGNGASLCAMHQRQSVATTMGFTALEGLMMGTRCGQLDPGVVLYLLEEQGLTVAEVTELLYKGSGLKGISNQSHDMQVLLESDTVEAEEAIALFCFSAAKQIGSLLPVLGGLECLVFTAGIGEHAPLIRAGLCDYLTWLGLKLNTAANEQNATQIHASDSEVQVLVIPTDEESVIVEHVFNVKASLNFKLS